MRRCPRQGQHVVFSPTPAARAVYGDSRLRSGTRGRTVAIPVPGGKKTCLPGPRGGMVYVDWEGYGIEGVFAVDLEKVSKRKTSKRKR